MRIVTLYAEPSPSGVSRIVARHLDRRTLDVDVEGAVPAAVVASGRVVGLHHRVARRQRLAGEARQVDVDHAAAPHLERCVGAVAVEDLDLAVAHPLVAGADRVRSANMSITSSGVTS